MLSPPYPESTPRDPNTIKGIRALMCPSKEHWRGHLWAAALASPPERVVGSFASWSGRGKDDGKVHIEWESDGRNSDEFLRRCCYGRSSA